MENIAKAIDALGEKIKKLEFDLQMKDIQIEYKDKQIADLKKEVEEVKEKKKVEKRPAESKVKIETRGAILDE